MDDLKEEALRRWREDPDGLFKKLADRIEALEKALTNAKNWCPNCRGVGYHLWSEWVNDVGDFVERKSDCHTCAPIRAALTEERG